MPVPFQYYLYREMRLKELPLFAEWMKRKQEKGREWLFLSLFTWNKGSPKIF